ncbi:MAG: DUF2934 domain-containing protein [Verrucomicrobia subdivision 3 bacterium]|nr:DUF2934 domain-containing protein [Verrucomicrobiota bacterium]MCC6822116.1 DUF2934 domain-containing protein [Limisphaerales bacterium]
MKPKNSSPNQKPPGPSSSAAASDARQSRIASLPPPDQIAKRAYIRNVNEGSQPGRAEQHWLEAEAQLHAEITSESRHHAG